MIYLLDKDVIGFPDPREGDEDGFFAVGGDLSPLRLLLAYSYGIFPWYAFRTEDCHPSLLDPETNEPYIQWWCPMKRFVIFPSEVHISHSMRQELRKVERGEYRVTFNHAFDRVMDCCGSTNSRLEKEGAWLGPHIKEAYGKLFQMGYAASVEVWEVGQDGADDTLIGGLYGVTIGQNFFGESMFSIKPSGSKIALITLSQVMESKGMGIIDCQLETPHLASMGGRYITYDEYLQILHPDTAPPPADDDEAEADTDDTKNA